MYPPRSLTECLDSPCGTPSSQSDVLSTRSPTILAPKGSRQAQRKRLANLFSGKARVAYKLNPILEQSLSSSLLEDDNEDDSVQCCKRGCTEILTRLKDVFDAIGLHNARTQASYAKSYPNPKKNVPEVQKSHR